MYKWTFLIIAMAKGIHSFAQSSADSYIRVKQITNCKGDSVQITAETNGLFQGWTNKNGKTEDIARPAQLVTWVCPNNLSTYIASSLFQNNTNLILNGSFEQDTLGFTSDYKRSNKVNDHDLYNVGTSANSSHSIVPKDKSSGTGAMLFADGSTDSTKAFYKVQLAVQAGTEYLFSAWICNTHKDFRDSGTNTPTSDIQVDFDNGIVLGHFKLPKDTLWHYVHFSWIPTNTASTELRVRSLVKKTSGNDIAMDEVFFGQPNNTTNFTKTASLTLQPCYKGSVFSPDGDGSYDTYYIEETGTAKIYDLGGNLIKEQVSPSHWDGSDKNGQLVDAGYYAIVVNGNTVYRVSVMR